MHTRRFVRFLSALALIGLMVSVVPLSVAAQNGGNGQGNATNAHACRGDWGERYRIEDGSPFRNQGDCVSYGAQGGISIDAMTRQCFDGFSAYAPSDAPGVAFGNLESCLLYGAAGGAIVPWVSPATPTLSVAWYAVPFTSNHCGITVSVTGFTDGTYPVYGLGGWTPFLVVTDGMGSISTDDDVEGILFQQGGLRTVTVNGMYVISTVSC